VASLKIGALLGCAHLRDLDRFRQCGCSIVTASGLATIMSRAL